MMALAARTCARNMNVFFLLLIFYSIVYRVRRRPSDVRDATFWCFSRVKRSMRSDWQWHLKRKWDTRTRCDIQMQSKHHKQKTQSRKLERRCVRVFLWCSRTHIARTNAFARCVSSECNIKLETQYVEKSKSKQSDRTEGALTNRRSQRNNRSFVCRPIRITETRNRTHIIFDRGQKYFSSDGIDRRQQKLWTWSLITSVAERFPIAPSCGRAVTLMPTRSPVGKAFAFYLRSREPMTLREHNWQSITRPARGANQLSISVRTYANPIAKCHCSNAHTADTQASHTAYHRSRQ